MPCLMKLGFQCSSVGVTSSAAHCAMEPAPDSKAAEMIGEGKDAEQMLGDRRACRNAHGGVLHSAQSPRKEAPAAVSTGKGL